MDMGIGMEQCEGTAQPGGPLAASGCAAAPDADVSSRRRCEFLYPPRAGYRRGGNQCYRQADSGVLLATGKIRCRMHGPAAGR